MYKCVKCKESYSTFRESCEKCGGDVVNKYNGGTIEADSQLKETDLVVEEYSFEELMEAGRERYNDRLEEMAKAEAKANSFEEKVGNITNIENQNCT